MELNKKRIRDIMVYLVPLICAGLLNMLNKRPDSDWFIWRSSIWGFVHLGLLASLIIEVVYLQWYSRVRMRFPQKHMRKNVALFVAAFILLHLLTVMRYTYVEQGGTLARYLWYAYYTPLTFGPLFMVYASLYFGKPDDYRISKKWYWAFLPASIISLGIITNDLHQMAFRFPNGFAEYEHGYTHGILYYLAFIWSALGLVGVIALAIRSTFHRRLFKTAWLPAAILAVVAMYPLVYVYNDNKLLLQKAFEMNDFICVICIVLWESFVSARIVVPNTDYPDIFAISSLNAGLADRDFNVRYCSAEGTDPGRDRLRAALNGEILLEEGEVLLKARPVQGGWFYWTEDISDLRRLNEALNDTADYLEEENALLRVSAQIEEGRRQTAVQTKLYDRVTQSLAPQLEALNLLLSDLPEDEEAFRKTVQKAGLLIAYLKRRSNLLLQADSHPVFSGEELALCFEESAKALRMANVFCEVFVGMDISILAGDAVRLYETFEAAAERALDSARRVNVTLRAQDENRTAMELNVEGSEDPLTREELNDLSVSVESVTSIQNGNARSLIITVTNGRLEQTRERRTDGFQ